ncbi:MAG: hypothetical protein RJB39_282 [Candidatus Parcubacteria bacterium]|jgi:trigger factor
MFDKKTFKIKNTNASVPCQITLEVHVSKEAIAKNRGKALKNLNEQVKIDGFRPGHVPEKVLIEKVGDYTITEEACRSVIDEVFSDIVLESKKMPINQPQITVTKLAIGDDAELKITFATPPEIDMADYKKLAKKHKTTEDTIEKIDATDEEIDAMLLDLRKKVAHMDYHASSTHGHDDHSHGDLEPVALDDAFAKKVGPFQTVNEVREAIKKNIIDTKHQKALEKTRIVLIDKIIEESKIQYPDFFLDSELNIMIEEMKADIARMGTTFDAYLKQINKTEKDLKDERKEVADKRVKSQLALSKIAALEELKPDENLVAEQIKDILRMHPTADKENVRAFVERFEMNQLVWKFLDEIK